MVNQALIHTPLFVMKNIYKAYIIERDDNDVLVYSSIK